jgi:hypothetical protein
MNNIERILVQDAFTIDVYYNYDVVGDDFNFEVLRELKVESLSSA